MSSVAQHRSGARRGLVTSIAALAVAVPLVLQAPPVTALPSDADLVGDGVFATAETDRVAPGLDVTRFSRLEEAGWTAGAVLHADLDVETLAVDVVNSGAVTEAVPVSEHLARSGAVAAVNGDFFDINYSNAARGTAVGADGLLNGTTTPWPALTLEGGMAAVSEISTVATITAGDVVVDASGVNTPQLPTNGVGVYTPGWGTYTLDRPVGGPDDVAADVTAVTVVDGVVTDVRDEAGDPRIPADGVVLLGRDAGATTLATLAVGTPVTVDVDTSVPADVAITGNEVLLADGVIVADDPAVHPRTAVGVSEDGSELYVLALDGRAHFGRGMSMPELAQLLLDMGAHDAVNLDGGGSTTMVARLAGQENAQVLNRPSDGAERPVPNALAFFSTAPGGTLEDVQVGPASDTEHADRVIPGLHRTLEATGLDANLAPVTTDGAFAAGSGDVQVVDTDGELAVVTGVRPGEASVRYTADGITASTAVDVLGELDHVSADREIVALESATDSTLVHVTAYDGDGHAAPVEHRDMRIETPAGITVTPEGLDGLRIGAESDDAAGTVAITVAGHRVELAVTAGLEERPVLDLADGADWRFEAVRATGAMAVAEGPEADTHGLRLTYDFTQSTATRGAYAIAPEPVALPGQPRSVSVWLHGSADGEWPRLQVRTGDGVVTNLDGPMITWEGWQQVTFPVPPGTAYPLTFERVRLMETRPDAQYSGEVVVGPISVIVAPDVEAPVQEPVHDPVVVTNGTVAGRPLQIAVMSDAQFVAREPDSPLVAAARRTLREIVAARPELLVINGDLVDEATPEDFALARRVLTEEVGDAVPWVYVPGNHEIMGGEIQNFIDAFGPTHQALTVDRTRVITLDSSTGTLRGGGMEQLAMLEQELAAAATDPGITGVLVFAHHPTQDPLPSQASQLLDREEAAALERALADFRETSGRSAALVNGHVGVFHARSSEGVSYLVNGNSGKGPAGTPETGGFTGWTMLGVNPGAGAVGGQPDVPGARLAWLRAEVTARVDDLVLDGPGRLRVGEEAPVTATVVQDDGRLVPVGWPLSAQWGGRRVVVDDGGTERARDVAVLERASGVLRFNPATGMLTAVRPGAGTLTVTVNGVTEELHVVVTPR